MLIRRKVFAHSISIYDIPVEFYKRAGVKYVFMDLDNTLDSYRLYVPTDRARTYIGNLIASNITPIIISNNKGKRVSSYANALGIEFMHSAAKPFGFKIKKFLKEKGIDPVEVVMVGDQLITDIGAANKVGIRAILTEKIVKEDQWTTHFNRLFDKPLRKRMMKKGLLKDWRLIYGQD